MHSRLIGLDKNKKQHWQQVLEFLRTGVCQKVHRGLEMQKYHDQHWQAHCFSKKYSNSPSLIYVTPTICLNEFQKFTPSILHKLPKQGSFISIYSFPGAFSAFLSHNLIANWESLAGRFSKNEIPNILYFTLFIGQVQNNGGFPFFILHMVLTFWRVLAQTIVVFTSKLLLPA